MEHCPLSTVNCQLKKGDVSIALSELLLTDAQLGDDRTVAVDVLLSQIVQHAATLTDHHQQTTTGVVVMLVHTQVLGQLVDTGSQDGNLDLGGAGVAFVSSVVQVSERTLASAI